ncbi:Trypanosomal VSG domain/Trypanosome variant surface glycoprotein C-terminal domain containing protein, putative [Trypanosoma equiperdum]|uniref:Trypanosomal VSG domain/Trypanosome variant surface glycoprotein C-terminal domain containing protein, putative n=1 Tax=Trypanosoma equiperdum TaxID=5694 RepID=A0A1G4I2D9_TRYEQ|nr:Trypanosomal VSG domain/Trypanosome variant surface glycoprotein C-terminal domain containing protein, putative [Trypanosoma equiperdum]
MFGAERVRATVPALGNREAARRLCELAAAATATSKQPTATSTGTAAFNKLHALNLSSSPPAALKVFKHKGDEQGWQREPPDSLKETKPWDSLYTNWLEGAKVLDVVKGDNENELKAATKGLTADQKIKLQTALAPILKRAHRAHDKLQQAQQILQDAKSTAIPTTLAKAMYGADKDDGKLADTAIFKTAPDGNNRAALCNGAAGEANVKTVAAALICICAPDSGGSEAKACFQTPTAIADWDKTAGSAKTIWNAIKVHCGLAGGGTLTAPRLAAALNNVLSQITKEGSDAYLGTLHTGSSCTGASTTGMCIKFAGATKPTDTQVQTNTWIKTISASISQLQAVETASREQDQATEALETMLEEGLATAQAIRHEPKTRTVTEIANPNKQATETDCNKHREKNECADPCKWNDNATDQTKKCSLDPKKAAEQATQTTGTGEGTAGATTDKCGEAKTTEECTKVTGTEPKGKKAVCGWIDFIDGQGKVEPKCRSSSFLVNKKLDLMAAGFMGLEEFRILRILTQFYEIYEINKINKSFLF